MSKEYQEQSGTEEIIRQFAVEGKLLEKQPYGNGHINDTYLLTLDRKSTRLNSSHS